MLNLGIIPPRLNPPDGFPTIPPGFNPPDGFPTIPPVLNLGIIPPRLNPPPNPGNLRFPIFTDPGFLPERYCGIFKGSPVFLSTYLWPISCWSPSVRTASPVLAAIKVSSFPAPVIGTPCEKSIPPPIKPGIIPPRFSFGIIPPRFAAGILGAGVCFIWSTDSFASFRSAPSLGINPDSGEGLSVNKFPISLLTNGAAASARNASFLFFRIKPNIFGMLIASATIIRVTPFSNPRTNFPKLVPNKI